LHRLARGPHFLAGALGDHRGADPVAQPAGRRRPDHPAERPAHGAEELHLFAAGLAARHVLVDLDELRRFELSVEIRAQHARSIAARVERHATPRLRTRYSARFAGSGARGATVASPGPTPTCCSPFTMPSASAWL